MFKKITAILLLMMIVFSTIPAYAAGFGHFDVQESVIQENFIQKDVIYKREINVTENGGVYQVGFVTIKFPKDFIDEDQLPVKIKVEISAVNGVAGIEFTPDIPVFNKDVSIKVHSYYGPLYDETSGKNIFVHIKQQMLRVKHFSRYAFS